MKYTFSFVLLFFVSFLAQSQVNTLYDFRAEDIDGKLVEFSRFRGKKVMIVNVASKCGLTPQYKQLQALYEKYNSRGFEIIAFPANNFMKQEPGTNAEIREFCSTEYGVTFPMMSKISVKGEDMHLIYQWLTQKARNGKLDSEVSWNFQKYLIDEKGYLVDMMPPRTKPDDEKIVNWIEGKSTL